MRNMIQKATIVLGVALIAFTACRKDNVQTVATTDDETALATQAVADMDNVGVYTDENTADIYMDDEGITPDFAVEAEDADVMQGSAGGTTSANDSIRARIRSHSFMHCMEKLNLSDTQKVYIRKALKNYALCKESAVKRAREIYEDLQKAYKAKAEALVDAYKNGRITKDQLQKALSELRENFRKELRSRHLAEKLDEAMKMCFREFLGNLHRILTAEQWKAFVACHTHR